MSGQVRADGDKRRDPLRPARINAGVAPHHPDWVKTLRPALAVKVCSGNREVFVGFGIRAREKLTLSATVPSFHTLCIEAGDVEEKRRLFHVARLLAC